MSVKETLEKSGIRASEYGLLAGVSKVAVYQWLRGGEVNALRKPRLDKLNAAISSAVDAGELPLEAVNTRSKSASEERFNTLRQIVIKHLRKQEKPV